MLIWQLFATFFKIGMFSFGGGYAMIPLMEQEVVTMHGWLSLTEMVRVIAVSQMTPGPIAINLATFVGFKTAGLAGALAATLGVVLPSFVIVLLIVHFYEKFQKLQVVEHMFQGIRPMAVALVGSATYLIAQTSLVDGATWAIGIVSFLLLRFTKISPALVIAAAGAAGIMLFR